MENEVDLKELWELNQKLGVDFKEFAEGYKNLHATVDSQKTLIDEQKAQIEEILTKLNRPPTETKDHPTESKEMTLFKTALRTGEATFEGKALYRIDAQTGGVLAPKQWVNELLRDVVEMSPMRSAVRVRQTTNVAIQLPKYTGTFAAAWVNEKGSKTETTGPAFGVEEVATHEMYALVDLSVQDIEDANFPLESFLQQEFALQFALAEGTVILKGTGQGQPYGILDPTFNGIETVETAGSNVIDSTDLTNIIFKLKGPYQANAQWVMHRGVIQKIAELRGSQEKQFLWQPGMQAGLGAPLFGKSIIEAPDMAGGLADNDLAVIYGDLRAGYTLVDRINTQIVRDPLTKATDGLVRFIARRRIGGRVMIPEALKILKVKA